MTDREFEKLCNRTFKTCYTVVKNGVVKLTETGKVIAYSSFTGNWLDVTSPETAGARFVP